MNQSQVAAKKKEKNDPISFLKCSFLVELKELTRGGTKWRTDG